MQKTLRKINRRLKWKEKIIVNIFPKTCYKIYKMGIDDCFKWINTN